MRHRKESGLHRQTEPWMRLANADTRVPVVQGVALEAKAAGGQLAAKALNRVEGAAGGRSARRARRTVELRRRLARGMGVLLVLDERRLEMELPLALQVLGAHEETREMVQLTRGAWAN